MISLKPTSLALTDSVSPTSVLTRPARLPAPKLKDSCHNCATAKLRCGKEKPTCSRCAKRGKTCQYFATKRGGRKRIYPSSDSSSAESSSVTQISPAWSISSSVETASSLEYLRHTFTQAQHTSNYLDILAGLSPSIEPTSTSITGTSHSTSGDFFASWVSLSPEDTTTNDDQAGQPESYSGYDFLSSSSTPIPPSLPRSIISTTFDESFSEANILSNAPISLDNQLPVKGGAKLSRQMENKMNPSSCLLRATDILNQLYSYNTTGHTGVCNQDVFEKGPHRAPTAQQIIKGSETILEAVKDILECPCSQDGYVLTIVCLTVFKVLDRYALVAREISTVNPFDNNDATQCRIRSPPHQPNLSTSHAAGENYKASSGDHGRTTAQLILGELYRVQRLVNVLSQRVKGTETHGHGQGDASCGIAHYGVGTHREHRLDLPPALLAQAELDLRNHLRSLSIGLVNMLKIE